MTEREILLYTCQREVGDRLCLLVTADWMAEHDEPDLERGLRWMVKWQRRPHLLPQPVDSGRQSWMWTCFGGINEGIPHATLPRKLCGRMAFWEWRGYASWEEAVWTVGVALGQEDVDCVGDPAGVEEETVQIMDERNQALLDELQQRGY